MKNIMHKKIGKWRNLQNNKPYYWNWNIKIYFCMLDAKKIKLSM
jgi:hypothetical protein